jgi:hypothetical protein
VRVPIVLSLAVLLASVIPLSAHHTSAYIYDVQKAVTLKGTVTGVEWKNPHVLVHVDGKTEDGRLGSWTLEARAAYIMKRQGMEQDFLRAGDSVAATVCLARDGSYQAGLQSVDLANGASKWVGECVPQRP